MRQLCALGLLLAVLGGCSSSAKPGPTPSPTHSASPVTPGPTSTARPAPTATVTVGKPYAAFLHTLCAAFSGRNAGEVINLLPYYQYNSGLRYGMLGDGLGQTGDPNLMRSWLASARPRCVSFTPGYNAHGTVLTVGWKSPGPASLLDLDIFSGHWKINDFTFGDRASLLRAMHTSSPIVPYRGQ